jgi:nitrate/nitrite transporter NarK
VTILCLVKSSADIPTVESTIIVCYIILVTVSNPVVRYLALIVAVACAGSAYPVIWPERIRALDGTVAAGIGIGLTNAMAQFGGIVGPHVYSTVFGPSYHVSYMICLSFLVVAISAITLSWWLVVRKDRRAAAKAASVGEVHASYVEGGKDVYIPTVGTTVVAPTKF